jgi:hypothetical protein
VSLLAALRGVRRRGSLNQESPDEFDEDDRNGVARHTIHAGGRIIIQGDGTEVLTDSDETEMYGDEHDKDDRDEEALEKNTAKDTDVLMKDAEKDKENEKIATPSNAEGAKEHKAA